MFKVVCIGYLSYCTKKFIIIFFFQTFNNKSLLIDLYISPTNLLSHNCPFQIGPAQQQSLREKRYATAGAHIQGLAEEEKYRGTRLEDILGEVTGLQEAKTAEAREESLAEGRRLSQLEAKKRLGFDVDAEEFYGSFVDDKKLRVGNKQGGSLTWRNNNPGAIKWSYGNGNRSGLSKDLEAAGINIRQGSPMTDGGHAIAFASEDEGWKAAKLLLGDADGKYGYRDLTLEEAMKRWSGGGYGAGVWNKDYATNTMSTITGPLLDDLIKSMKGREEWDVGTVLNVGAKNDHTTWTESAVRSLAEKTGIGSTELWSDYTDAELDELALDTGTSLVDETVEKLNTRALLAI